MVCKHTESGGHSCFAPSNAWVKPCEDCPQKAEAQAYIDSPDGQEIIKNAKKILKDMGIE